MLVGTFRFLLEVSLLVIFGRALKWGHKDTAQGYGTRIRQKRRKKRSLKREVTDGGI